MLPSVCLRSGSTYNIGTDFEISNLDFAKTLIRLFGLSDKEKEVPMRRLRGLLGNAC